MSKPKYVEFPLGINKRYLDDACYELDRETNMLTISSEGDLYNFPKKRAQNLVNRFSIKQIITLRKLAAYLFFLLFFLLFLTIPLRSSWFSSTTLFLVVMIPFFIASYLLEIEDYFNISKCKKCGRDFAYEEIKMPLIKKVSTYDNYEKTETRYFKCKYCKNEELKIESLLKSSKSKRRRNPTKGKICKGCRNKFSLIEYRYPDTHLEYQNAERTIKHYKCKNCGYMEISIQDKTIFTD